MLRYTIRYDTIRKKSLTWTQKLIVQLNLAHEAGKNMKKKKLKQTNASVHLVQYRLKIREGSPEGIKETMEERILWKRDDLLSLEWKAAGVADGESNCDEVIRAGWGKPAEWTEEVDAWRNEEASWFHRYGDAYTCVEKVASNLITATSFFSSFCL